jgi:hypothetical protein
MKQIELSRSQEIALDNLARSSKFWSSVRAKYAEFGALTSRQFEILEDAIERRAWQRSALRVAGAPVRNRYKTDGGKPRCAHAERPWCTAAATIIVGALGYCAAHARAAMEARDEWLRARAEERAQGRAAEEVGA